MLEQFANAIMIEKGRYISFAQARSLAYGLSIDPELLVKSTYEHEVTLILLDGLEFLYRAADSESVALLSSNLRHAVEILKAVGVVERSDSPNRLILMKTELLEGMISGDKERVSSLGSAIATHPFVSETTSELSCLSRDWVNSRDGKTDTVIAALTQDSHPRSPWIRIARRILNQDARDTYGRVVRDRARLIEKPMAIGEENYRRGRRMESLLQLHFMRRGYVVQPRLFLEGVEVVDIFCYRTKKSRLEIALVDVKHTKRKYGPKEARDFAGRIRELRRNLSFVLPSAQGKSLKIVAVVASSSGLSENGKGILKKQLDDMPLEILPVPVLRRLLKVGQL